MTSATLSLQTDSDVTGWRSPRAALIAFCVWLVLAAAVLLWVGRGVWVASDDWMLTGPRSFSDVSSLLRDHNQHFSLIPVLIYKSMFSVLGFNSYLPYRLVSVAVHLTVVVLLRVIMRDANVGPWIATVAAGTFAVFNSGGISAAQFQMPLGLMFGLAMVIVVSRSRLSAGMGVAAVALGVCAVASSGIAVPIVIATGAVAWRRHSLLTALVLTVPVAAVYVAWWLWDRPTRPAAGIWHPSLEGAAVWARIYSVALVRDLGGWLFPALLVGVFVGAVALLLTRPRILGILVPGSLVGAAVLLQAFSYIGRGFWLEGAQARFIYLTAALCLPAVAIAWAALTSWRLWAGALIAVPLVVQTGPNVRAMDQEVSFSRTSSQAARASVAAMLYSSAAESTPDYVRPWWSQPFFGLGNTEWGYLQDARDRGLLDLSDVHITPALRDEAIVRLRVIQTEEPAEGNCRSYRQPQEMTLPPGSKVGFRGGTAPMGGGLPASSSVAVRLQGGSTPPPGSVGYWAGPDGGTLQIMGRDPLTDEPLAVVVSAGTPGVEYSLCR